MGDRILLCALLSFILIFQYAGAQEDPDCTCPCRERVTIADLYSNGPLPYVPALQSDLPASPFQLDLTYDCDADSVTLIFCSGNVTSKENARASPNCYVADLSATQEGVSQITRNGEKQCSQTLTGQSLQSPAPIRIRTNTNDGQGYFDINLSPDASLSIHESSTNLDFDLLKRLYAYTTGGTSCNIQFAVQERTELTNDESANGDNVRSETVLEKEPTKEQENVEDGESSTEDQADSNNGNPSNSDDDTAGNQESVDGSEPSLEDQADSNTGNPLNSDDDTAGNQESVDGSEPSPEDQADSNTGNPSNSDDVTAGNQEGVDDGESSPEHQADSNTGNPSNSEDDTAGNQESVDGSEPSPEDQADSNTGNPSNSEDDTAGNQESVDGSESLPEDQADSNTGNPPNSDDDTAGNQESVDGSEPSPEDQADSNTGNRSNSDDVTAGNQEGVDDGESSPEDQADGNNRNPSNNDLTVEDYPSVELQAAGPQIPIYKADNSSDFSLNFIVPHDSQSIQGLVFFLLPSTSSSEEEGYVIRFDAGSLNFTSPGDDTQIEYTYNIGNVPAGASMRLVVEGNTLYIRILQGETYINLVTALTIKRASIQTICVGATRVFYLRYYCGLLQWISQPSAPELDDDTPKDYKRLTFVTEGSGDGVFDDKLKFNVLQTSRYDFLVQAQRGAVLYLSSSQDASSAVYRLVIGDGNDGNTISLYRASDATTSIAQANSPDVLNQYKYVRFSLTISRNPDTKVLTFLLDLRNFHSSIARRLLTFTDSVSYEQASLYLGFNSVGEYRVYWICYLYFIRSGSSLAQGYTQTTGTGDRPIQVGPFPAGDRKLLMATNLQSDLVVEFLDSNEDVVVTISFGIDDNTKWVITQNGVELASELRGLELTDGNEEYAFAYIWISFSNGRFQAGYQFESSFISSDSCTGLSDIRFATFRAGARALPNVKYTNYYWRYFVETTDGELVGRFNDISYRCHDMEEDAWGFSATVRVELPECWGGYVLFGSRSTPIGEIELRPGTITMRDGPNGNELGKIGSPAGFTPSARTYFGIVSREGTSSLSSSNGSSLHTFQENTQSYCLAVSPCRDLSVSGTTRTYSFRPEHVFQLSHFTDTPASPQGDIKVNLTQLATPVVLQFATAEKKTYSISLDVDTGGESGTISLSRFNILVKSQDVNGLHLNGQLVDIRIANQKVQITLEGSVVFEYEDTAQPPNAGAKCLIQNAQVQYSFTSTGSGSSGISDTSSHPEGSGSSAGFDPSKFTIDNFFNVPEHLKGEYIGLTLSKPTFPAYIEFADKKNVSRYLFTFLEDGIITLQVSYEEVNRTTVPELTLTDQNIFFKIADNQVKVAFPQSSNDVLTYVDANQPADSDTKMLVVNFAGLAFVSSTDTGGGGSTGGDDHDDESSNF